MYAHEFNPTPSCEPSVHCYYDDYFWLMSTEADIFVAQIYRQCKEFEWDLYINLISRKVGGDKFISAELTTDSIDALNAFNDRFPKYWDSLSISELLDNKSIVYYYGKHNPDHLQSLRNRQQNINAE